MVVPLVRPIDPETGRPIPKYKSVKNRAHFVLGPRDNDFVEDDENPIWEQQPNEATMWYERFFQYLRDGVGRSIPKTYDECVKMCRNPRDPEFGTPTDRKRTLGHRVPPHFREYTRVWRWVDRAKAWDRYMADQERRSWEEERIEARKARIKSSKTLAQILAEALSKVDPDTVNIGLEDAANVLKIVNQELRMDYNDLPDTRVKVDSKNETDVLVTVQGARDMLLSQLNRIAARQGVKPPTIQDLEPEAALLEGASVSGTDIVDGEVREIHESEQGLGLRGA